MRLWALDIIPYLPRTQMLALWRELNSIYKNQPRHLLINYVYNDKQALYKYSLCVIEELKNRHYNIKEQSMSNFRAYFGDLYNKSDLDIPNYRLKILNPFWYVHTEEYLAMCYFNLKEKYMCQQKDFTKEIWDNLNKHIKFVAIRQQSV